MTQDQLNKLKSKKHQLVMVHDESEESPKLYLAPNSSLEKLHRLFAKAATTGEYPEEANDVIDDTFELIKVKWNISTTGDEWGIGRDGDGFVGA